ncbi:MAG: hypothetical protein EOP85_06930 [Verrucomicrobiaceae bacterium]|nr:MAG: hypothetical protein EOP85_06930 [Verrucomicrobiaceae bacterium]
MTNRPVIAIFLALVVESAHWVRLRWDFNEDACGRTWRLTSLLILISGLLIYLDGNPYMAMPNLLTWMPALLIPMQFVQSFGMADSLPLNTFSFLAKQRRNRNRRLGIPESSVIHINFGNIYFVSTLVASTLGSKASAENSVFLPGIIILTGWILLSSSRSRPIALLLSLGFAGCLAFVGQRGLLELEHLLGNRGPTRSEFDPNSISTAIGRPIKVNLSPNIVWRMRSPANAVPPKLLRTATYNTYRAGNWVVPEVAENEKDFNDLSSRISGKVPYFITTPEADEATQISSVSEALPRFTLRGAAAAETPLPLPGDTASLKEFELDGIESNRMGTVRIFPKNSVVEGTVLWKAATSPDTPPSDEDKVVPPHERAALRNVIRDLDLGKNAPLAQKLAVIRAWFQRDFTYSRDLKIISTTRVSTNPTAITQFLTTHRSGHCEYFASATVLLLREMRIPARYATGFSVLEHDMRKGESTIRGSHGHAWCRIWDEEAKKWTDFDTTPASWIATVPPPQSLTQRFNDWLTRVREDFFLWRNQPDNRTASAIVMLSIGLGVAGFVFRRLWKSRRRMEALSRSGGYEGPVNHTPLNAIETQARKKLGPRPLGQPFGEWLAALRPQLPEPALLDEAIELHQQARFDPAPVEESRQKRLAELANQLTTSLKRI